MRRCIQPQNQGAPRRACRCLLLTLAGLRAPICYERADSQAVVAIRLDSKERIGLSLVRSVRCARLQQIAYRLALLLELVLTGADFPARVVTDF